MKKIVVRLILVLAAVGIIVGCRTAPVYNVTEQTIVANTKNVEADKVKNAIIRAGATLGWQMKVVKPGQILGTLYLRDHMAQVEVTYNTKSYSIIYKDSLNLKYDDASGTIHNNYNGWVQRLQRNIDIQLATM